MYICVCVYIERECIYICRVEEAGFPGGSSHKESAGNAGTRIQPLGWDNPLEKEMATTPVFLPR